MWPNRPFPADLVTFTEEILNEKLHFLCSVLGWSQYAAFSFIRYLFKYFAIALESENVLTYNWSKDKAILKNKEPNEKETAAE